MTRPPEVREVHFGDTTISYEVIRGHRRRKTVEIRADPVDGIRVAVPALTSPKRVEEIVRRRAPWILRQLNGHSNGYSSRSPREFVSGETFEYLGRQTRLQVLEDGGLHSAEVHLLPGRFVVKVQAGLTLEERETQIAGALNRWYRTHAAAKIKERVSLFAERLGANPSDVLIRDQKTRWGSCSAKGVLRFNWRIVMAPLSLVDYVVAHELCHILHPNHGSAFWSQLASLIPDCELRRQRLRRDGLRYRLT